MLGKRGDCSVAIQYAFRAGNLKFIKGEVDFGNQILQVRGLGKQWKMPFVNLLSETRKDLFEEVEEKNSECCKMRNC